MSIRIRTYVKAQILHRARSELVEE